MKNLYHILLVGIALSLGVSMFENIRLWHKTRMQERQIEEATKELKESNEQLEQKLRTQIEFSKNINHKLNSFSFFNPLKEEISINQDQDSLGLEGIQLYDFEKKRENELSSQYFRSTIRYMFSRDIEPKLSSQDSLYFGYSKYLIHDTKYELKINGEKHDFKFENRISKPSDEPIKIELTQISISEDGMQMDTSRAIRTINKS